MIRHILFWKYTEKVKKDKKEAETLVFLQNSVETMNGKIDGLIHAEIETNIAGGEYDLVFYTEFRDKESLKAFMNHPLHVAHRERCKDLVTDRLCGDLETKKTGSIFHRVSIRKYEEKIVEQEKIESMLKAAMAAPSACNQQPWEYYVVTNRETIEALSKTSPYAGCAKEAPVVFVPCYRKEVIAPEYCEIDMSASVENLLLEADELGLGAVWMGIAPDTERKGNVRKVLNIPEALEPFALVSCGYPSESRPQEDRYDTTRVYYVK